MFVLNRFPVSSFTLLLAIAAVRLPAAAQAPKPAEGAAAGAPAPALGPRVAPPARGALNPAGWTVGPDGKRHAPIPKRETEPSPLPDLKPEQPLITVNGEPISWGAVRDYAELLVSEMRIPHGVTPQQFEEERDNLLMRRVYSLGRHHILKTLLAQEARRKGIVLAPEEVAAKEKEVLEKLRASRKQQAERYLKVFQAPGSFYHHDLTNSLLLAHLEKDVIRAAIQVTETDIDAALAKRQQKNREMAEANAQMRPKLETLRKQILDGSLTFADAAFTESDCDSSYDHGEVGSRAVGDLQPAMVNALTNLAPGVLSDVVETPYSYHLLKLNKLNLGFLKEGEKGPAPVVSINFAHIMLEKKEPLPLLTRDEMKKTILDEETLKRREALQEELLAKAKIETPLKMGNDTVSEKKRPAGRKPRAAPRPDAKKTAK